MRVRRSSLRRTAKLFFLQVSFVFAGIEACTSWETCYPPRPIVPLFTWYVMQSVHLASITDQSVYLTDQLEILDRPTESSDRSSTLPVDSKASFPCRSSASEVQAKRPIDAGTLGHPCSTDAKSFARPQLVWMGWRN